MLRGAYHTFHLFEDAVRQAELFLRVTEDRDPELPPLLALEPVLGTEASDRIVERAELPLQERIGRIQEWISTVAKHRDLATIIYTTAKFWDRTIRNSAGASELFAACAGRTNAPLLPKNWTTWAFWHYGKGRVCGDSTLLNIVFFNGRPEELRKHRWRSGSTAGAP
jgi:GH25 family lysozyme M1 (1,4-beta-N-acetylmuramidase)